MPGCGKANLLPHTDLRRTEQLPFDGSCAPVGFGVPQPNTERPHRPAGFRAPHRWNAGAPAAYPGLAWTETHWRTHELSDNYSCRIVRCRPLRWRRPGTGQVEATDRRDDRPARARSGEETCPDRRDPAIASRPAHRREYDGIADEHDRPDPERDSPAVQLARPSSGADRSTLVLSDGGAHRRPGPGEFRHWTWV
jgi:hypothetical protein